MEEDKINSNLTDEKLISPSKKYTRRTFMKKAAYAAPKLIALGYLVHPVSGVAAFGPPDGASGGVGGG